MDNEIFKIILILLVSSIFISCNGQFKSKDNSNIQIGKTVTEIHDQVWAILQDKKGNYWFGSNGEGVFHFDGKTLTQFTTLDGLEGDDIRGFQEDHDGNIYVETPQGISKYNGSTFETLNILSSPKNQWKLEPDDLWFGYNANDLYRYDGTSLIELKLPRKDLVKAFGVETNGLSFDGINNTPYAVFGVDKDKAGNIWFGTATAGAFRYDGNSILWFGEKELSTLPDGRVPGVRSMIQDKEGYFWLSNFYSKYKIDKGLPKGYEKLKAVDFPAKFDQEKIRYFNSGISDKEGNLWMTTYGGGVWKYDGETLFNFEINNGARDILLITIYQDSKGTIWLGTNNDGVYKRNGEKFEKFKP